MDRGAWRATDHGVVKESDTTYQLNNKVEEMTKLNLSMATRMVGIRREAVGRKEQRQGGTERTTCML